jgi:hypothetical protein
MNPLLDIIPEGNYILIQNVESALLRDRRQKRDWTRAGTWFSGERFKIEHETSEGQGHKLTMVRLFDLNHRFGLLIQRLVDGKIATLAGVLKAAGWADPNKSDIHAEHMELAALLLTSCEIDEPKDFDDLYSQQPTTFDNDRVVLKALVMTGKITVAELAALYRAAEDGSILAMIGD